MTNRGEAPSNAEVEEKKRLVDKLKAEKAARDKQINDLEGQLKTQKREVMSALAYLDKLAKDQQDKLAELKKAGTPEAMLQAQRIEAKLGLYRTVRAAAGKFEETMGTANPQTFAATALSLRLAEGEAVVANARMVLADLAPGIEILKAASGQPAQLPPSQQPLVMQIKARLKVNPGLMQQLTASVHFYQEAQGAAATEETHVQKLKGMQGKEALQFAANTMKISQLAGKVNHLWNLHATFATEPLIKPLFPEPVEIDIPKLAPGMTPPAKGQPKALTGILKELLGFK